MNENNDENSDIDNANQKTNEKCDPKSNDENQCRKLTGAMFAFCNQHNGFCYRVGRW